MRQRLEALGAAVRAEISRDEIVLAVGLILVTVALWPDFGIRSLIVPGAVFLWHALPTRAPFFLGRDGSTNSTERRS